MRDEEVTLTLAPGEGQVAGMSWVVSGPHQRLLCLHVWGTGRTTNIPELGFGTARIHLWPQIFLAWLQLREK